MKPSPLGSVGSLSSASQDAEELLAYAFTFGTLGPFGGSFAVWVIVTLANAHIDGPSHADLASTLGVVLGIGWLIGVIPATLTGCAAWLTRNLRSYPRWLAANVASGALVCVGPPTLWFFATGGASRFDPTILIPVSAIGLAGAIGAVLPSLILHRRWQRGSRRERASA